MALQRQYIMGAVRLASRLCSYLLKHQDRMVQVLGPNSVAPIGTLIVSCQAFHDFVRSVNAALVQPEQP